MKRGGGENTSEILADLYNPKRAPSFNAYIDGRKRHQLIFQMRPYGAIDCEEVLLVNADFEAKDAGFLRQAISSANSKQARRVLDEDKRVVDAEHYKIETAIKGDKLSVNAECARISRQTASASCDSYCPTRACRAPGRKGN
ncbi:MAG: hypothetical protein U0Y68_22245 [Blastocatellia bacterium]